MRYRPMGRAAIRRRNEWRQTHARRLRGPATLLELDMEMTKNLVRRFAKDEEGAALIEYTVLLGIMLVTVIASIIFTGGWIGG